MNKHGGVPVQTFAQFAKLVEAWRMDDTEAPVIRMEIDLLVATNGDTSCGA